MEKQGIYQIAYLVSSIVLIGVILYSFMNASNCAFQGRDILAIFYFLFLAADTVLGALLYRTTKKVAYKIVTLLFVLGFFLIVLLSPFC